MQATSDLEAVHKAFIGFNKRAERASDSNLVATFVDSAPLFDLLSTANNQVIYGRRGTGKTHALKYLAETVAESGGYPVYLDLRTVGSNGSIYNDASRPLSERASKLILDVLGGLFDELYNLALDALDDHPDPRGLTARIDRLQQAVSTIQIVGTAESEESSKATSSRDVKAELKLERSNPSLAGGIGSRTSREAAQMTRRAGVEVVHLSFGNIASALSDLQQVLGAQRIWLLIDEWSEVPLELQPYLADLLRRIILPINDITVKIAAIEHRSFFRISKARGEYIGLELGADVSADLNLDDFLVFDNSQEKSTHFVKTLLFNHYTSGEGEDARFDTADELIQAAFTQHQAFEEFVRAVEGVPRDALNLAAKVATKAFGQKIAMQHVRDAARDWYTQDKSAAIRSDEELTAVLAFIVDSVIGKRRARAFLFQSNSSHDAIEKLFDSRLLHVLKRNISSHDRPGARFDVYKIDYGCYVDLISTTKAPTGLFEVEIEDGEEQFVDVPRDDYRSIRRAILDASEIDALFTSPGTSLRQEVEH